MNMFSRELEVGEVEQISRCEADLQGDVVSWTEGQWDLAGGVTVTTGQFQQLCEKNFAQDLVIVPEPVTFQQVSLLLQFCSAVSKFQAGFLCDFLSSRLFSAGHPTLTPDQLYSQLRTQVNILFVFQCISKSMSC